MDIRDVYEVMRDTEVSSEQKETFRSNANKVISRPIPKELIKQREGGNKMMLSYIEGETVIRLLNEAFGEAGWSFQIVNKYIIPAEPKQATKYNPDTRRTEKLTNADGSPKLDPQPPIVEVIGRLTVPGFGVREQFGTKTLIGGSSEQEGASKAAATDALKKCSTLFGIGLELYDDKPGAAQPQKGSQTPTTSSNASNYSRSYTAPAAPKEQAPAAPTWKDKEADTRKLKELKAIIGIDSNSKLDPYVAEFTGNKGATYEMITPSNITSFNQFLEKKAASM
jgi:recombination DNA repair RAD52 pathway protein